MNLKIHHITQPVLIFNQKNVCFFNVIKEKTVFVAAMALLILAACFIIAKQYCFMVKNTATNPSTIKNLLDTSNSLVLNKQAKDTKPSNLFHQSVSNGFKNGKLNNQEKVEVGRGKVEEAEVCFLEDTLDSLGNLSYSKDNVSEEKGGWGIPSDSIQANLQPPHDSQDQWENIIQNIGEPICYNVEHSKDANVYFFGEIHEDERHHIILSSLINQVAKNQPVNCYFEEPYYCPERSKKTEEIKELYNIKTTYPVNFYGWDNEWENLGKAIENANSKEEEEKILISFYPKRTQSMVEILQKIKFDHINGIKSIFIAGANHLYNQKNIPEMDLKLLYDELKHHKAAIFTNVY